MTLEARLSDGQLPLVICFAVIWPVYVIFLTQSR